MRMPKTLITPFTKSTALVSNERSVSMNDADALSSLPLNYADLLPAMCYVEADTTLIPEDDLTNS